MITKDQAIELGDAVMNRDPREYPYGYFSGGSFALDSARVFMWFADEQDLIKHIADCDPAVYDLDEAESVAFSNHVHRIFKVDNALSSENLELLNAAASSFFCVDWWGTFDELTCGDGEFARQLRSEFREGESDSPIVDLEMDDFIDLIQHYGF